MQTTTTNLSKNKLEITITLDVAEFKDDLARAAVQLSEARPIPGYRPGKAPYDAVKSSVGEMSIYEQALSKIIHKSYNKAVKEQKLITFGEPKIEVKTLAPENPIVYTATVILVPKIEKLPDYKKASITEKHIEITEAEIDKTLEELRKMQTRETTGTGPVGEAHKAVVDLDLFREKVPVEGGQARAHGIYMHEDYYIPGIKDALTGMNINEIKSFTVTFPKDHFQQHLAGHEVEVKITVKEIFDLVSPELNDEFAKSLGQDSMAKLRERIKLNMKEEMENKEHERVETELLTKLVAESHFDDIPNEMVNAEVERMIHELDQSLKERDIALADYLQNIKKTMANIKTDFAVQAMLRIKTALLIREIGNVENIEVDDLAVANEVTEAINRVKDNPELQEYARGDEYQDRIRTLLRNRKVMEFLHGLAVKHE